MIHMSLWSGTVPHFFIGSLVWDTYNFEVATVSFHSPLARVLCPPTIGFGRDRVHNFHQLRTLLAEHDMTTRNVLSVCEKIDKFRISRDQPVDGVRPFPSALWFTQAH